MKTQEQRCSPLKSHIQSDARPMAQMKALQFRSIAPKAPTPAPSPAVLSCQPPSTLPEASVAVTPKSILVPAQNYALMQVAGQEGTFSLVALPQTPPPQQIQKNLKLPIPRYQPVKSKKASEKALNKTPESAKVTICSWAKSTEKTSSDHSSSAESPEKSSEKTVKVESAALSEVLVPESAVLYQGSQTEQTKETNLNSVNSLSYPARSSSGATLVAHVNNSSAVKAHTEGTASAGGAITVLSPTLFSKAVQIIPSPPKGKLPILPYAKVKNTLMTSTGHARTQCTRKNSSIPAKNSLKNLSDAKAETAIKSARSTTHIKSADTLHSKKPSGKRPGRKRKTAEDILAFEARKKRFSFFPRRVIEKPPAGNLSSSSQEKVVDISKKYRSIRPKPVLVMEGAVPQLVPLPSLSTSDNLDKDLNLSQQMSGTPLATAQTRLVSIQAPGQQSVSEAGSGCGLVCCRPHRCTTCGLTYKFKHHLQSHMKSHSNLRPYGCPVCRKAYVRSDSLSTHMKLHHAEGRPRKSLRCEFCEKAFGYVGVYFSHLREVHKVILTVEPSISQHEENTPTKGCPDSDDPASEQHVEPVELQIKCGRCQAITPTFADMKFHLRYVHAEEVQVRPREGAVRGSREAEDELVKLAAHYWRQLNERRNLVRCGSSDEEFFSKLKHHLPSQHQEPKESRVEKCKEERDDKEYISREIAKRVTLTAGSHFNCILCSDLLSSKQDVLEHWRGWHNCENPAMLWEVLHSRGDSCTPDHSPK